METFLHLIWEQRMWEHLRPVGSLEGCDIEILDVGICNQHAGPDFFEAKIRIDDLIWVGAVEIHRSASEWLKHQHHLDPAYSAVIMHVVEIDDGLILAYDGRPLPTLVMTAPSELRERAEYLVKHAQHLPCSPLGLRLDELCISSQLKRLADERLRQKAELICSWADQYDWYEALYITLMRYFGFDLNNDSMEQLARSLPYKLVIRYTSEALQFDALLLGQASLIDSLPHDEYRTRLEQEYSFLSIKHGLKALEASRFRQARRRPSASSLRRLLQVAGLLRKADFSPTSLARLSSIKEMRAFFTPQPLSGYWQELYQQDKLGLSRETIDSLIINIALPFRLALRGADEYDVDSSTELKLQAELSPERNKITRLFERAGIRQRNASDSQAVIQAYKQLCSKRKCLFCPWGRRLLSRPLETVARSSK